MNQEAKKTEPSTTKATESFNNDNLSITMTREPGCRVHFDITVTPKATKAARAAAIKNVSKEVSFPGFRKGKAPAQVIEKNFGSAIKKEWDDVLLNTSFNEALKLAKTYPFKNDSVKSATVKSVSLEEGATLSIDFEAFPRIPDINSEDLTIQSVEAPTVTEKHIEDALEQLRMNKATWKEIADRPAKEGDYVELDIDIISEPASTVCERQKFHIAEGKMEPWMRKLIIGKNAKDTVEGESEKSAHENCDACHEGDTHHHAEDDNFKPVTCRITIQSIQEPTLPSLDDELAKSYGATDTNDLKEKVTKSLHDRAEQEHKNRQRSNAQVALLNKYIFDLPYSLIQAELLAQRRGLIDYLRQQGTAEADIPAKQKELELQMMARLERELRLFMITQHFSAQHKIQVSDNEAMMEYLNQMWYKKMSNPNLPQENEQDYKNAIESTKMQLLVVKMLDKLLEKTQKTS